MQITPKLVADKLAAYLQHRISLAELVAWAENSVQEGVMEKPLMDILARIGLADVPAFALTWEDCENFLGQLGYKARIEVSAA